MFNIRKKKLKKILDRQYESSSLRDYLRNITHKELHILAEEIIWKNYDGYNTEACLSKQKHYDYMDRDSKEFFIYENSSLLGLY